MPTVEPDASGACLPYYCNVGSPGRNDERRFGILAREIGRQDYPACRRALQIWASSPALRLRAGSRTEVLILSQKIGATGLSRLPAGSANLGFAVTLRLGAGSRTKVLILSQKIGATGLSRLPAGSANLGFALALRLRAGSPTEVLIL